MITELERRSATIFEFPRKARNSPAVAGEPRRPAAVIVPAYVASATCGSGWYHEAAIEEARRDAKR
jgi:Protein of unknown function (DUF2735)